MSLSGGNLDNKTTKGLQNYFKRVLKMGMHGICFSPYTEGQNIGDQLSKEQISIAFERDDLIIYTDPAEFKEFLFSQDLENTAVLLMSSGNYGGLDFEEVKSLIAS